MNPIYKAKQVAKSILFKLYDVKSKREFYKKAKEIENDSHLCSLASNKTSPLIIVSLTSFPVRFCNLHYVIKSILEQSVKVDRICLYLDDTVSKDLLPQNLKDLESKGLLEILFRDQDIKPHKKYYFAIKEHPDDIVITVDDDLIYPNNLVESLIKTHQEFPTCVVACRGHKILFDEDGVIKPYNDWLWEYPNENEPSMKLFACGSGGVLYPPHCMKEEWLLRLDLINKLSKNNDDIWLKAVQVKSGTKVVFTDRSVKEKRVQVYGSQTVSLNSSNVNKCVNDTYIECIMGYFGFDEKNFAD